MTHDAFDPNAHDTTSLDGMRKLAKLLKEARSALDQEFNTEGAWNKEKIDQLVELITHDDELFEHARQRLRILREPLNEKPSYSEYTDAWIYLYEKTTYYRRNRRDAVDLDSGVKETSRLGLQLFKSRLSEVLALKQNADSDLAKRWETTMKEMLAAVEENAYLLFPKRADEQSRQNVAEAAAAAASSAQTNDTDAFSTTSITDLNTVEAMKRAEAKALDLQVRNDELMREIEKLQQDIVQLKRDALKARGHFIR